MFSNQSGNLLEKSPPPLSKMPGRPLDLMVSYKPTNMAQPGTVAKRTSCVWGDFIVVFGYIRDGIVLQGSGAAAKGMFLEGTCMGGEYPCFP